MYTHDYEYKNLGQQKLNEMIAETAVGRTLAGGYDVIIPSLSNRVRITFKTIALKALHVLGWQGSRKSRRASSTVRAQHMATE